MRKEDFVFDHKDDEYQYYWFHVIGDAKIELTNKHMEMCMVEVTDVVFSATDGVVGIKQLFPFNYDVVLSDDTVLKEVLVSLTKEVVVKETIEK